MVRLFRTLFLALAGLGPLLCQNVPKVQPEAARSHLVRSVEPVYPAFAKAAGLEGVVRFEVDISSSGRIYSLKKLSGPPSLEHAAADALGQHVYRPFEENGHPINVTTTVDVVFKLGADAHQKPAYPPQKISLDDFTSSETAPSLTTVSAKLRLWLQAYADKHGNTYSWLSAAEQVRKAKEWLDSLRIVELPAKKPGVHLYFVSPETQDACGATGNCQIELAEENATGVQHVATASGWGFYARLRAASLYPDIFISTRESAREQGVAGYVNVSGFWGLLYCGLIRADGNGNGTAEIQVCR